MENPLFVITIAVSQDGQIQIQGVPMNNRPLALFALETAKMLTMNPPKQSIVQPVPASVLDEIKLESRGTVR